MRFSKISITKAGVHLVRVEKSGSGAVENIDLTSPEKPLASFGDALQAFKPYVIELLSDVMTIQPEKLKITTLSLSDGKDSLRGLIVSGTLPVEKAYNKPLSISTPLVRQGGENASAEAFVLSDEVMELIELAEAEATRYAKGERVQLELIPAQESENTKAFNERAASAEVSSTRKPRGKKKEKDFIPGVGPILNPGATEQLTDDALRQLLLSVERDVPIDALARWTSSERESAATWASMRQREILNALKADEKMPPEPSCVIASATATLADAWADSKPPKPDAVAIDKIKTAAGRTSLHVQ